MEKTLKQLGLAEKEARVYMALANASPAKAGTLARDTSLPRQTINSTLKKLLQRGFVTQGKLRGINQYFTDPKDLLVIIDRQKQALDRERRDLEKALPALIEKQHRPKTFPKVSYYEGVSGMKQLFEHILKYYKKNGERRFRAYGINKFGEVLGDYLYDFVKKRHAYGVKTELFIGKGEDDFMITDGRSSALGRTVKHLNMPPQQAGAYIVGDAVYLFSYRDNVGIKIENAAIVELLKASFDDHWKRVR